MPYCRSTISSPYFRATIDTMSLCYYNRFILNRIKIIIANLFNRTSTNNQYDVINFGLKHGTAIKPKENDTFVFA